MNGVDLGLLGLLLICALRGYWRGFFRESFGLVGLIGGLWAALRLTRMGQAVVLQQLALPETAAAAIAFVVIFTTIHTVLNVIGLLLSRSVVNRMGRAVNGVGGAVLGTAKGTGVLAVVLLFLHLFPFMPTLDSQIMTSTIGRPLVGVASTFIRSGARTAALEGTARRA